VGFVGAAESKALLVAKNLVPYITVTGTRGGSSIAVSMINALLYYEEENIAD
jgi:precorrin-8X/cobalt-precorrin-8 methylmutase